jgi:nitroreductase
MAEVGLYETMRTLRAVRRLRADPVPDRMLHRVLEAASWAPTGGNVQPWRAIVVRERSRKEQLGRLYEARWTAYIAHHRSLIATLPEAARVAQERIIAAGDYLAKHFAETPVVVTFCFNPEWMAITDAALDRVSVVGGASIYTAVQNFLLACRAEGLGCVLTTLLCQEEPAVRQILAIPKPWATAAVVPIGFPVGRGHGPISRRPVAKLVYAETWGAPLGSPPADAGPARGGVPPDDGKR